MAGLALSVSEPDDCRLTVSPAVTYSPTLPLAASTLTEKEPTGVEAAVVSLRLEVAVAPAPEPARVTLPGVNATVAPVGTPVALSVTSPAKPLVEVSVTV